MEGIWHRHVDQILTPDTPELMRASAADMARELTAINTLIAHLDDGERETLPRLLDEQFVAGVHDALVVLHESGAPLFEDGVEGTPFHDFVGRLDGWTWPSEAQD